MEICGFAVCRLSIKIWEFAICRLAQWFSNFALLEWAQEFANLRLTNSSQKVSLPTSGPMFTYREGKVSTDDSE